MNRTSQVFTPNQRQKRPTRLRLAGLFRELKIWCKDKRTEQRKRYYVYEWTLHQKPMEILDFYAPSML